MLVMRGVLDKVAGQSSLRRFVLMTMLVPMASHVVVGVWLGTMLRVHSTRWSNQQGNVLVVNFAGGAVVVNFAGVALCKCCVGGVTRTPLC